MAKWPRRSQALSPPGVHRLLLRRRAVRVGRLHALCCLALPGGRAGFAAVCLAQLPLQRGHHGGEALGVLPRSGCLQLCLVQALAALRHL